MRLAGVLTASPGRDGTPTNETPRSAADLVATSEAPVPETRYVPAGHVLPPAVIGDLSQYTSPPAFCTRLITVTASFSSCETRNPAAPFAATTVPRVGFASSVPRICF